VNKLGEAEHLGYFVMIDRDLRQVGLIGIGPRFRRLCNILKLDRSVGYRRRLTAQVSKSVY
jgi:hypothetical protein